MRPYGARVLSPNAARSASEPDPAARLALVMAVEVKAPQVASWESPAAAQDAGATAPSAPPPGLDTALFTSDDPRARRDLRDQIAGLERELCSIVAAALDGHGVGVQPARGRGTGARILSTDELERMRDSLAGAVQSARRELSARAEDQSSARALLERMLADPSTYRWVRVSNSDLGEPGCRHWHSRPRFGLLGVLCNWWRVKVSSGCPLARGRPVRAPLIRRRPRSELVRVRP